MDAPTHNPPAEPCDPDELKRAMQTLLENLPGMVYRCRLDAHWTMLYVSDSALDITGYTADELRNGRPTFEAVIHPNDRARVREVVTAQIRHEAPYQLTYRIVARDGGIRWIWERGQRVGHDATSPILEGYITDITHQHILEHNLQRASRRETLGLLAGGFLHDLSNMVLPLSANLDLLDAKTDDPSLTPHIAESLALCERIIAIANQTRDLLQTPIHEHDACAPRTVLERFAPLLRRLLTPQHTLSLDLARLPASARAPITSTRLEQIALNLVINAIEASPQGSAIHIQGETREDRFVLTVSDTGPGIAPEHAPKIFDASFTTRPGGTGLGLYHTAHSVRTAGGQIEVASAPPEQPTTFTITLPTIAPVPHAGHLLLVEPNHALRLLAERHLKQLHYHVFSAPDLDTALAALETPDRGDLQSLVLGTLDADAPVNGFVERVRARFPNVSIVRLSELTMPSR